MMGNYHVKNERPVFYTPLHAVEATASRMQAYPWLFLGHNIAKSCLKGARAEGFESKKVVQVKRKEGFVASPVLL